jgi:hypothetical protein
VPGPWWTSDLSEIPTDPIDDDNVVYPAHIYPGTLEEGEVPEEGWERLFGEVSHSLPVVVTEWGFHDGGDSVTDGTLADYGIPLVDFMDERDLGWLAYIYHPFAEPMMLETDWVTLTELGSLVEDALSR